MKLPLLSKQMMGGEELYFRLHAEGITLSTNQALGNVCMRPDIWFSIETFSIHLHSRVSSRIKAIRVGHTPLHERGVVDGKETHASQILFHSTTPSSEG